MSGVSPRSAPLPAAVGTVDRRVGLDAMGSRMPAKTATRETGLALEVIMARWRWALGAAAALTLVLVALIAMRAASPTPVASDIGGRFELVDQTGKPVDQS